MATSKKDSDKETDKQVISKHKRPATRRSDPSQAFDIIPASRVMPSATSRPVITQTSPGQSDNTLTQPASAPLVQSRKQVKEQPAAEADTVALPELPVEKPAANTAPEIPATGAADGLAASSKPAARKIIMPTTAASAEPAEGQASDQASEDDPAMGGMTMDSISDATVNAPQGKPADTIATTAESSGAPDNAAGGGSPQPALGAVKPPVASAASKSTDSVADVLAQNDQSVAPQQHSEALKSALKDLDEHSEAQHHHHELYGGKPVIVVHKAHKGSFASGLLWFLVCLVLAAAIVDVLADANYITVPSSIPTTNFL